MLTPASSFALNDIHPILSLPSKSSPNSLHQKTPTKHQPWPLRVYFHGIPSVILESISWSPAGVRTHLIPTPRKPDASSFFCLVGENLQVNWDTNEGKHKCLQETSTPLYFLCCHKILWFPRAVLVGITDCRLTSNRWEHLQVKWTVSSTAEAFLCWKQHAKPAVAWRAEVKTMDVKTNRCFWWTEAAEVYFSEKSMHYWGDCHAFSGLHALKQNIHSRASIPVSQVPRGVKSQNWKQKLRNKPWDFEQSGHTKPAVVFLPEFKTLKALANQKVQSADPFGNFAPLRGLGVSFAPVFLKRTCLQKPTLGIPLIAFHPGCPQKIFIPN